MATKVSSLNTPKAAPSVARSGATVVGGAAGAVAAKKVGFPSADTFTAAASKVSQTLKVAADLEGKLPDAREQMMVGAKIKELMDDHCSMEEIGAPRFAANLALEISEDVGTGKFPPSAELTGVLKGLVEQAKPVFEKNTQALESFKSNLATGNYDASQVGL